MTPRWPGTVETFAAAAAFLDSILSPMAAMALGFGPMNTMPAACKRLGKGLALGQKAVAGMHGLRAARLAGGHDLVDQQIAFGGLRRADGDGGIGHLHVQGVLVGLRIDGDRLDAHFARGLDDPAGDFAAIGNQDTLEHAAFRTPSAIPAKWLRLTGEQYCLVATVTSAAENPFIPAARRRSFVLRRAAGDASMLFAPRPVPLAWGRLY